MKGFSLALIAIMSTLLIGIASASEFGVDIRFSTEEARIIRAFYEHHQQSGESSKKKGRGSLPPGVAKNLGRGKALPPGIAKQVLPGELVGTLPPVPGGYERVIVDGKILLVEIATQVIHDVLTDIILR